MFPTRVTTMIHNIFRQICWLEGSSSTDTDLEAFALIKELPLSPLVWSGKYTSYAPSIASKQATSITLRNPEATTAKEETSRLLYFILECGSKFEEKKLLQCSRFDRAQCLSAYPPTSLTFSTICGFADIASSLSSTSFSQGSLM